MTEDDIDFRGVLTDAAAAGFAGGEFDCVGVFAPFTLTALERPGSHVLFSSADFPGSSPTTSWPPATSSTSNPADVQKLVDAWYLTLDYIEANPDEATEIMAGVAETSVEEYEEFAEGTTLFTRRGGARRLPARRRHDVAPVHGRADQPVPGRVRAHREGGAARRASSTPASPRPTSTGRATERQRQDVDRLRP